MDICYFYKADYTDAEWKEICLHKGYTEEISDIICIIVKTTETITVERG